MVNYNDINSIESVVVPASDEKIYDKMWLSRLVIDAPSPSEAVRCRATLKPCRDIVVGEVLVGKETIDSDKQTIHIDDLFAEAEGNVVLQAAINALLSAIDGLQ